MVWRKMTIGASGGSVTPTSSFVHSTPRSGSDGTAVVRPVSGGSTFRLSAARRERSVASTKLAFALRAHGVGW